jgi:hypothetical protein
VRSTGSSFATSANALTKIAAQPGGAVASARASSSGRTLRGRVSETKGTPIEACMRSATRRRGIEIFRTVPRIVPLKSRNIKPGGRIAPST